MKLVKFAVTNFRSIKKAEITISDTTVLVGKNNEGKSNLLNAISVAMYAITNHGLARVGYRSFESRRNDRLAYNWERDFPISSQNRTKDLDTWFRLEFELSAEEIQEFKKDVKSSLNGTLPLEIFISKNNKSTIKVAKGGRGSITLNDKSSKVTEYIAKRISFNHIHAVRTHQEALSVIDNLLSRELASLEKNSEYKNAITVINALQKPVLEELSKKIKEPLLEFLPNIRDVKINLNDDSRLYRYRRDFEVIVDDGTPTSIEYKGDGVKSLAALGLLKNRYNEQGASIIAIEEPESHLHPGAIHQLQEIISSLGTENQIILTTHNPLFVNRNSVSSNIIIDKGKAVPAKNIKAIRDILGVKVSDNLINSRYVLVVEGKEDQLALSSLLPFLSEKLAKAIRGNDLLIEHLGGAGGLLYKLSSLENQVCSYHVFMDNDEAARVSISKAIEHDVLQVKNINQTMCQGMVDSEFEDCLSLDCYRQEIIDKFGVDLNHAKFRGNKKWSDRVKYVFLEKGKPWSDSVKQKVKYSVADMVNKNPSIALCPHKRTSIDGLVESLEKLVA